jgi:AraC family transcriptional regulator
MAKALGVFVGRFGRVAFLEASQPVLEHAHSQTHILIKISGNDGHYVVAGEKVPITDDEMVLVDPWVVHSNPRKQDGAPTLLLAFWLEALWFGGHGSSLLQGIGAPLFPNVSVPVTDATRQLSNEIAGLIQDLASDEGQLEDLLLRFMRHVITDFSAWKTPPDFPKPVLGVDHRIRKAVRLMRADCSKLLDLNNLASDVGLSRSRFYQQFRSCVGVSPRVYLDTLCCEYAIDLLANHDLTLAEISEQLGFNAQAHFTRFFKSKTGVAPSNFRQAIFEIVEPKSLPTGADVEPD